MLKNVNLEQRCPSQIRKSAAPQVFSSARNQTNKTLWNQKTSILKASRMRRKAIEQTIKPIGIDELKSLGEKLFPFLDHPWRNTYFQFLEDNSDAFFTAAANDQVEIIYCPDKRKVSGSFGEGHGPIAGQGDWDFEGDRGRR